MVRHFRPPLCVAPILVSSSNPTHHRKKLLLCYIHAAAVLTRGWSSYLSERFCLFSVIVSPFGDISNVLLRVLVCDSSSLLIDTILPV